MSDGKADDSKENKKMLFYWVMIIVTISTGVSVIILGYGFAGYWGEDSITESDLADKQELELKCEKWLEIGDSLVKKYDNNKNITEWSESDRMSVLGIEDLYQKNCIPTQVEIMSDLKRCTAILITIETLIDKMVEKHLNTLSEDEQKAYNHSYEEYFDNHCNRIKDEIQKTNEFMEFNKTRGQ